MAGYIGSKAVNLSTTGADINGDANIDGTLTSDGLTVDGAATITVTDNSDTLTLVSTDADATVGPVLNLFRNSASPADNDVLGRIVFKGEDSAGNDATFARIEAIATDVTNGSEDGRIDFFAAKDDSFSAALSIAGQNVGIGTSSPVSKLHIDESAAAGTGILLTNDNNTSGTYSDIKWQYTPSDPSYGSGIRFKQLDTTHGGQLEFFTDNTSGTYTQRMTITEDGNVGIGTSSPASKLSVAGDIKTTIDNSIIAPYGSLLGFVKKSGSAGSIAYASGQSLIFSQSSASSLSDASAETYTERMRITSSGSIGIGTSSPYADLHVTGTIKVATGNAQGILGLGEPNGSTVNVGLWRGAANAPTTDGNFLNLGGYDGVVFATGAAAIGSQTERMRIDSSGNLLVGKTSATASDVGIQAQPIGRLYATRDSDVPLVLRRNTSDGNIAQFLKDGTTVGSIATLSSQLYIGSSATSDAYLRFGNSVVRPCASDGANRDNAIDLGASGARFDDIYATNGTIQTSDRNEKQDIAELTDAEQRVAVAAKGLLRKFRWRDAVEAKGDDARTHFGIIAQDLQAAFAAEGLDAGDYAMFISSTWTDEETGEERTRMGVRYSELLAFIIGAL